MLSICNTLPQLSHECNPKLPQLIPELSQMLALHSYEVDLTKSEPKQKVIGVEEWEFMHQL